MVPASHQRDPGRACTDVCPRFPCAGAHLAHPGSAFLHCQVTPQQRPGLCLPVEASSPIPSLLPRYHLAASKCTWSQDSLSNSFSNTSLVCLCPKSNQNQNLAKLQILYLKNGHNLSNLTLSVLILLSTFERIHTCPHQRKNENKTSVLLACCAPWSRSAFLLVPPRPGVSLPLPVGRGPLPVS